MGQGTLRSAYTRALIISLLATACTAPPPLIDGEWTGDVRLPDRVARLDVSIDSSGNSAMITLPGWQREMAPASRVPLPADRIAFTAITGADTVLVQGTVRSGIWIGEAKRGTEAAAFELRRLHRLTDLEWSALVGTYRSSDGRLLGIAPFSEFRPRPFVIDYTSGRIGPLYAVARDRFLVGNAVMSPVFPADTLELGYGPDGEAIELVLAERERPRVVARRVATRDEAVQVVNGAVTLAGTITLPAGPPPYPALVLVHGSNALTRDVFGPWTRYFAGLGFAVLSYDKRGTGGSTGDWKQADFADLAADVLAGVRFMAARADILRDRVGVWGASQAGWIMPLVAARAPREVAFMIVHAGSGTTVREQGLLYLERELRLAGLPESSVAVGMHYQMLDDSVTRGALGWEALSRYYKDARADEPWLWPPRPADDWFRAYYRMLMDFDPQASWRRVRCPVLFFFGELDANVPPAASWPPIERALHAAGNTRVQHVVLARANHLFLEAETGARDEYAGLTRFVPGYFDRMARWLEDETR